MSWLFKLGPAILGVLKTGIKSGAGIVQKRDKYKAGWEMHMAKATKGSWKDEFWTIVIGMPLILQQVGFVLAAYTYDTRLLDVTDQMIDSLNFVFQGQYYVILMLCVSASFGVRLHDGVIKKGTVAAIASVEKKKAAHVVNRDK